MPNEVHSSAPTPPNPLDLDVPFKPANPEAIGMNADALSAITGMGAMAVGGEVAMPDTSQGPGFMGRRWATIKSMFQDGNPRNTPAAQAIVEAGGTMSRWDVAKATMSDMVSAAGLLGNVLRGGLAIGLTGPYNQIHPKTDQESFADREAARLAFKVDATKGGAGNGVLRRKMAKALVDGDKTYKNPVWQHLNTTTPDARRRVASGAVESLKWRREHAAEIRGAALVGGVAVGGAVAVASKIASHHL